MTDSLSVFIVEDDPSVLLGCMQAFELEGIPVQGAASAEEALQQIGSGFAGVVVSDIRLPGTDGMALLKKLRQRDAELPVILITGHGDISLAVQAMKDGAYDFIEKPFSPERLLDVTRRALEQRRLGLAVRNLEQQLQSKFTLEAQLIGRSPAMARIRAMIADLADTAANVLIHGETGCGKELVARCLHQASKRSERPFVALNCGGLSDTLFESELFGHEAHAFTDAKKKRIGKFEYANGGTLLFDEIESMPIAQQIKLLRVLQERSFERLGSNTPVPLDCRIIAATKFDLKAMSDAGQFRSDLYYRLNVVSLTLPPLRERREDIPLLFEHFLVQACARFDRPTPVLEPDEQALLLGHDWPGNVRELRNVAERFALGIRTPLLPEARGADTPSLAQSVEDFERVLIAEALRRHDGNLSRASESLKMPKTTLFDKVRKYGL
ncbi:MULTISPECIES: sigma-54 dependent transcriptional regulator [unclassified Paludibacterium]|uniref:sigma-54-dependent transcriptional regulator n=1 Tax=unclassified Paludibacterium TaxID=2618429 RepID=UPI001C053EDA|nr:sigma-54 dependent transcriptional regulator [Paludibacterium sp. B53371]BEV72712.1 sigma-54 dependent transcriptional regulator [Paludibacterium sp. THUN1379]